MIFKISLAADPSRSGIVWFRSMMVPSYHINYQKFGEFMFSKIITKKLILTSNFSSVLFRHTKSRQTFDTWFHNLGPPFIESFNLKPHSPWPAEVGGPRKPKSLNLLYCKPSLKAQLSHITLYVDPRTLRYVHLWSSILNIYWELGWFSYKI